MSFRKYQKAEGFAHLSKDEHEVVGDELRKVGKRSVREMDAEERADLDRLLDNGGKTNSTD